MKFNTDRIRQQISFDKYSLAYYKTQIYQLSLERSWKISFHNYIYIGGLKRETRSIAILKNGNVMLEDAKVKILLQKCMFLTECLKYP